MEVFSDDMVVVIVVKVVLVVVRVEVMVSNQAGSIGSSGKVPLQVSDEYDL